TDGLADADSGRPRRTARRRALIQNQGVGPALDAAKSPGAKHIGPGPVGCEAKPRVRALAETVVVAGEALVLARTKDLEEGVELAGPHHAFESLAGAGADRIVVITI